MMPRLKKLSLWLVAISLAISCGAWLLFSVPGTGWKALIVPTGSMRPALPVGSVVFVHRVPVTSLRVGDIITYISPLNASKTISHRIVKTYLIGGRIPGFVTKGDANPALDIPIAGGSVQGKVVAHVPWLGMLLFWARRPLGLILILYIPALFIIIEEVKRLRDYYKSQEPYRMLGYERRLEPAPSNGLALMAIVVSAVILIGAVVGPKVEAKLTSNTVQLTHNKISVKKAKKPKKCKEDNNIQVNDDTQQTAQSGGASGSNAASGNAQNDNQTDITVQVKNCEDD